MMRMDFTGQFAIVTGASGGIGRAIAEGLLQRGCEVLITTTKEHPSWAKEYPLCHYLSFDALEEKSISDLLAFINKQSSVDILVNNAGLHCPETIDKLTLENWRTLMSINAEAPMRLMQAVSHPMKKKGMGRILNIASIAAIISRSGSAAYSASKAALTGLTRAAALDLAGHGVLVNALCPGHTHSELMDRIITPAQQEQLRAPIPLGRFAKGDEIASMGIFLVSSLNTYITGQSVIVDGGVTIQ